MLTEFILGLVFTLTWAGFFILVGRQRSTVKASLGVFLLFVAMVAINYLKWQIGEPRGWFLGLIVGFPLGLWIVQKVGPEKPTEESAVAMFVLGPLVLAALLVLVLML
ncbi:hypothetical protein [Thermococcus sp. JdF3]|uniref:hypothetical protein n=1 Tax=Thermococcus sp. JdF3 TaxID=1638258 RepID=UPI00143C57E1|nr:hypothetical protein [Thermococcus sp. JdF3]NJE01330.1 hypothetical protein [Thermococcus sp. JdF3]